MLKTKQIVYWAVMVSPHMVPLLASFSKKYNPEYKIIYMASKEITKKRSKQGWKCIGCTRIKINIINGNPSAIILKYRNDIHIVDGIIFNGSFLEKVRNSLREYGAKWAVIAENIDCRVWWKKIIEQMVYYSVLKYLKYNRCMPDFILAIGEKSCEWFTLHGYPHERIFPFTYFISPPVDRNVDYSLAKGPFRIGFVGQLIPRKRVDVLIDALAGLVGDDFELLIVGNGPLEEEIKKRGEDKLGKNKVSMLGTLPMDEIPDFMSTLDCLVLPSDHDGWGVVVTEALMSGVPAICSDACGAAEAVRASGVGGVFPKGDVASLRVLLEEMMAKGKMPAERRKALASWAKSSFGAEAGAKYLREILACVYEGAPRPLPPWKKMPFGYTHS